jgi:DNA invertase Pin-like site-specific DNA recombinase
MDAVLYAAKSTKDKRGSIPDQLADGRRLAAKRKLKVAGEFKDEDKSAYHGDRGPELAAAIAECERLAPCALVVQHSDRLARGDAKQARHLIEIVLWAIKHDVELLSVQDPEMLAGGDTALLMGAIGGMRNNEDSKRKSLAVKDGIARTVKRGEWRGSAAPEGFVIKKRIVGKDTERWIEKHPDDQEKFEMVWRLAEEGRSALAISLEMDRRGWMTRPARENLEPKPFSTRRIRRILDSPAQAGLQVLHGETHEAGWDGYVDPATFDRLKIERGTRTVARGRGRPPKHARLLTGLAKCAMCGAPMQVSSGTRARKDGSRRRVYVCRNHRDHHSDSPNWCHADPFDAVEIDRRILTELEKLLKGDTATLHESLMAGQRAERTKLEAVVQSAKDDLDAATRAGKLATAEFADAEDDDERQMLKEAAKLKRAEAKQAQARLTAALDAMSMEPAADPSKAIARLWDALGSKIEAAAGDAKAVNAALREGLECVWLSSEGIVPVPAGEVLSGSDVLIDGVALDGPVRIAGRGSIVMGEIPLDA